MVKLLFFFLLLNTLLVQAGDRRVRHLPFSLGCGTGAAKVVLFAPALRGFADGDPVSTWPDLSGNGNSAAASGSARPAYKVAIKGGLPVVRFDGTNHYMDTATFSSAIAQPASFVTFSTRTVTGAAFQDIVSGVDYASSLLVSYYNNGANVAMFAGGTVNYGGAISGFNVVSATFNGASSSGQINGVDQAGLAANPGTYSLGALRLGDGPNGYLGTQRFGGDMGLVIVYPNLQLALRSRIQQATGFTYRTPTR